MDKIAIFIEEEYGYREWLAIVSPDELVEIKRRWETIRGLNCMVPVPYIFPTATQVNLDEIERVTSEYPLERRVKAHVHESDDSSLSISDYIIPESDEFEIDGEVTTHRELLEFLR